MSPFAAYMASGMIAEMFSCVLYVPVDIVKERLQIQINRVSVIPTSVNVNNSVLDDARFAYSGSWDATKKILKHEGIRGIYRYYLKWLLY